jgi:hypothetical protein
LPRWWVGLHALLGGAAMLLAWPWPAAALAIVATIAHAAWRWPAPPRATILLGPDGSCRLATDEGGDALPLGARTRFSGWWVHLAADDGPRRRDILLLFDQLEADDWRRLAAILRRTTASQNRGATRA